MGIEYASVVAHPLDEVFAWHTRPGAMRRLVPPWQPMRVVKETESLADGTAILGLPAGLRWIARHDPAGYDPPHQFRDVLSSKGLMTLPPRVIGWWRHTHRYSDAGHGTTRVHDIVDTTVYMPDTFELPKLDEVFREIFPKNPPARTVTGARLVVEPALVQLLATATRR